MEKYVAMFNHEKGGSVLLWEKLVMFSYQEKKGGNVVLEKVTMFSYAKSGMFSYGKRSLCSIK